MPSSAWVTLGVDVPTLVDSGELAIESLFCHLRVTTSLYGVAELLDSLMVALDVDGLICVCTITRSYYTCSISFHRSVIASMLSPYEDAQIYMFYIRLTNIRQLIYVLGVFLIYLSIDAIALLIFFIFANPFFIACCLCSSCIFYYSAIILQRAPYGIRFLSIKGILTISSSIASDLPSKARINQQCWIW